MLTMNISSLPIGTNVIQTDLKIECELICCAQPMPQLQKLTCSIQLFAYLAYTPPPHVLLSLFLMYVLMYGTSSVSIHLYLSLWELIGRERDTWLGGSAAQIGYPG